MAGTSNSVLLTPLRLQQWAGDNAAAVEDLQALTDPGADSLLMWDDSDGALEWLAELPDALLSSNVPLKDAENTFSRSEDSSFAQDFTNPNTGTSARATLRAITDGGVIALDRTSSAFTGSILSGGVTGPQGAVYTTGDVPLSFGVNGAERMRLTSTGLLIGGSTALTPAEIAAATDIDVSGLAATDGIYVDDAGVAKRMSMQDMGLRVVNNDANQTFALSDANTAQFIAATNRTWTIPASASVAFNTGAILAGGSSGAGEITIDPAVGVTINSVFGQASTVSRTVRAGGMFLLLYKGSNVWQLTGDIS